MGTFPRSIRRLLKLGSLAILLLLIAWVMVLADPSFLFAYEKSFGGFTVHSGRPVGPELESVMKDVTTWLKPIAIYDQQTRIDIFLCHEPEQFAKISRFTLRPASSMGMNLPEFRNCWINIAAVERFGQLTGGRPTYNAREGNLAHVITHEAMHQYLADRYGKISSRSLPLWKLEGYCEYGANFFRARKAGVSIAERLLVYQDDAQWNQTAVGHREHFLWGIMIEYLVTVDELSFEQIMDNSIERETVLREMIRKLSDTGRRDQSVLIQSKNMPGVRP